jgi:hypothetical protein
MHLYLQPRRFGNARADFVLAHTRFFAALFLLVAMAAHSLDTCASHFGFPESPSAVIVTDADCARADCMSCPQSHEHHADLCDTVSETATRTAQSLERVMHFL